jgi:hypothetical protein
MCCLWEANSVLPQLPLANQNPVCFCLFVFKEELPHKYDAWIHIAKNLPELIGNGQLRGEVEKVCHMYSIRLLVQLINMLILFFKA